MRIYVRAYAIHGQNEFHLSRFIRNYKLARADETKLAFWHLMERVPHPTKPGRYKRGVWRITDFGVLVIEEKRDLPNGRWMYNAQGKDFTDERVTIRDLLAGCPYSLEQLLVSYRLPDEL